MITERDLDEAIAECQGVRNPNADTCVKLASFYVIKDHITKNVEEPQPAYSFSPPVKYVGGVVDIPSNSDFAKVANGRDAEEVLVIMDELMSALQVMNPRLFNCVMNKF